MLDIVPWFGLAVVFAGFVTLSWVLAQSQAPGVQATNYSFLQARATVLNVRNLSSELKPVSDWYKLGINLGLKKHDLNKIQQDHAHQRNDQQRLEMLSKWLQRTPRASWGDVVSALEHIGEDRVAENIQQKYISGETPKILDVAPTRDEVYHKHRVTGMEYGGEDIYHEGKFDIDGSGLKSATTKKLSKFTVHTHDTDNRPTSFKQHVSAELKSLVDSSVIQATVVSQTPSTYELSYIPTIRGRHQLTVRVNNTEIGTFQVFVQHPPTQLGTPVRVIEGVKPTYTAVGDKGELFVTEFWDYQYTMLDAQGERVLTIGSKGKPPFEDRGPTGIAIDGEGNVYVASSTSHKVRKFNRHGDVIKSVEKEERKIGEFNLLHGVRYHNHQVYVCDSYNSSVQVLDPNLNFVRSLGTHGNGPGLLKYPRDVDFDSQGNIYVVDSNKKQVLVFSNDGQYLHHFGQIAHGKDELSGPEGLCVSGDYVYVTELRNNRVSVFCTSGEFVHSFGKRGSGRGEFNDPYGIAIDNDGFVFVCDYSNSRIQVF